ncbi:MAG: tyrosine-type recombinase/integrase [Bacteroidetes bacterium]|nr:tyrosine-type recombinase/integrase [Bacteroidota bacterium]MCB9042457.1 tyrosine-type recombinase/integrase [Chitinophagales bacterium]
MSIISFLQYLQYEKRYAANTRYSYESDLKQFEEYLAQTYQIETAEEVNYQHIRSWVVYLISQKMSASSVNRKLSAVKSYYRFLLKQGIVTSNPAQKAIAPKKSQKLLNIIPAENLMSLLNNHYFGEDFGGLRDKLIIALLFEMGIRLSELMGICNKDIDAASRTIRIVGKGNKERISHFSEKLSKDLAEYQAARNQTFENAYLPEELLLLTDKGKPLYPNLVHRLLQKKLSQISTANHLHPHVLRHSFATTLLKNGSDLNAIKELLGHTSLAATQVYTHNSIEKIKSVYNNAHPKA